MAYFYYATSHQPTAVTHAVVGTFTSGEDLNLILGKTNRLDIYTITDDGPQPVLEIGLYGRIATMKLIRLRGSTVDYLMITTERKQFMVLQYDSVQKTLRNVAKGDLRDRVGRACEKGQISLFDPSGKVAAFHMYDGLLKVVPCETGFREKAYNVRLDETNVQDMTFLHTTKVPTVAVLYKDMAEQPHMRTYVLSLVDKTLLDGPWSDVAVSGAASLLIPVPAPIGGVVVVGSNQITWHGSDKRDGVVTFEVPEGTTLDIRCYGAIDTSRFLLGDSGGMLYLLAIAVEASAAGGPGVTVSSLQLDALGECVLPSTLTYLDAGLVFVGSTTGDHHLLTISAEKSFDTGKFFTVKATYPNLGPIVDLCVQDLDRAGQGQVVCASGAYRDGSLRVIRNGVGIDEVASIDLPGIRGLWALRPSSGALHHQYLVQSYSGETRVMISRGESIEECEEADMSGFNFKVPTLFVGNMDGDLVLQVTAGEARLTRAADSTITGSWTPPSGLRITVATGNTKQILIAMSNKEVRYFELAGGMLVQKGTRVMPHDVACMNMNPLQAPSAVSAGDAGMDVDSVKSASGSVGSAGIAAVGLWTEVSLRVLNLTEGAPMALLADVAVEVVGGAIPPRSVLLVSLKGVHHAFLGIGDGHLYSFRLEADASTGGLPRLVDRKGVQLGRKPIALTAFASGGSSAVFAACDRPTIVHAVAPSKLAYSNVNLSDVSAIVPFSSEELPECLALASEANLTLGAFDEIQKLHVRTVHLGEQPRRVVHFKSGGVVAVAVETARRDAEGSGDLIEAGALRLFDDTTFEPLQGGKFELDPCELVLSMTTCFLGDAAAAGSGSGPALCGTPYIVVGTAYMLEDEEEPSKGRLLVFSVEGSGSSRVLSLASSRPVKGAVYSLACLAGYGPGMAGRLVAGIGSKVQVYKWGTGVTRAPASGSSGAAPASNAKAPAAGSMEVDAAGSALMGAAAGAHSPESTELKLTPQCGYHGATLSLHLETRGDFILVGDLMKSMTLLRFSPANGTVEVTAQDPGTMWITALALRDDTTFLAADHSYNLVVAERNPGAANEEERARLNLTGEFHTGEFVNRICQGSLVMLPQDVDEVALGAAAAAAAAAAAEDETLDNSPIPSGPAKGSKRQRPIDALDVSGGVSGSGGLPTGPRPQFILGSISGSIAAMLSLPPPVYKYLQRAQWAVSKVVQSPGDLRHGAWRGWYSEQAALFSTGTGEGAKGVVDGDLVEQLLDLAPALQQRVIDIMNGLGSAKPGAGAAAGTADAPALVPADVALHPNGLGSTAGPAVLSELIKTIEDLSRLH